MTRLHIICATCKTVIHQGDETGDISHGVCVPCFEWITWNDAIDAAVGVLDTEFGGKFPLIARHIRKLKRSKP